METLFISSADLVIRLAIAVLLGVLIGTERVIAHKTAGMRTYALVSLGSALFVVISETVVSHYLGRADVNPTQIAGQIVSGIGFLGAGLIIFKETKLTGLTTATGIWVSAGIGMAAGFGFFAIAISATLLTLFIFIALWYVEQRIIKIAEQDPNPPKQIGD